MTKPIAAWRELHLGSWISRRILFQSFGGAIALGALWPSRLTTAHAPTSVADLASVELPPALGQTTLSLYIPETGHTLEGLFLDYWRANGAAAVYGHPVSEPFAAPNGYYSQAFERGILQYRPEYLYTAEPIVRLMPIGRLAMLGHLRRAPDWRAALGHALASWARRDPSDPEVVTVLADGGVYIEATGHTISGDILAWYQFHEGASYLGPPLSEPTTSKRVTSQWFEGGLVEATPEGVALAPLGASVATSLGVDTARVPRADLPLYDEVFFWTAPNPNPLADPYTPGAKWIDVSLSQQRLTAYHGQTPISTTLVSTGLDPNPTETGLFHVRLKYLEQDMQGFTSETGEVIGFGEAPDGVLSYAVPDVPHVMYFNLDAEALHGTYWHNNFGTPMSHGCVNLPLDAAAWLYGWTPLGTAVWVHP